MSSPPKDSKTTENESATFSDLNTVDDEPATSTLAAPSSDTVAKKPGSPQVTPQNTLPDDDEDIEVHASLSTPAAATEGTATTTINTTAAVTPPATTPATTPAQVQPAAITTPASEREAKLAILTEAFPTVEKEVCEFVLESHRGNVEASINALLEISDPEFHPEPEPQPQPQVQSAPTPTPNPAGAPALANAPPALPRRQDGGGLTQGVANMNLGQNQPGGDIDPILLASTSTSEQQLRADEDFARTLAAMDEYSARDRQNLRQQQQGQGHGQEQGQEGPSFATEFKELMDEELPKIKERFNVAADTTKKKVTEWYNQFKTSRAEAAQRQNQEQGQYNDNYRNLPGNEGWSPHEDRNREPIRFGTRVDEDEPLARNRLTPPLGETTPPLPARPYNVESTAASTPAATATDSSAAPANRRTTIEDELDSAMNTQPSRT
ncbi:hypothetical protein BG011_003603 [Mortierella polycephala]|uniref:CUE domain-containing protein n=1 Tax=Mortierella polycephala TaxID=41804 RepID=A0A9P6U3G9_9FUNG|nr:hypothetical protein BG011_003603 [Mortierella polycephala]